MFGLVAHIAVEGSTDEYVVRSIFRHVGIKCGYVRGLKGKAHLRAQLPKYNEAAQFANWLAVVDLDQDADCAPNYFKAILPAPSLGMLLRIPVRAIEAWLLADRVHLAKFLNIAVDTIPLSPDLESDPKVSFIALANRSRKTVIRQDIVPRPNSGAKVGPGYSSRILEFLHHPQYPWRPQVAAEHSESLKRCINALKNWKQIGYHDSK